MESDGRLDSEAEGEGGDALANNRSFCAEHIGGHQANVVLKDNDLTERLRLPPEQADQLYEQLCADSELLRTLGIMDYSLLLGVSCVEYLIGEKQQEPGKAATGEAAAGEAAADHDPHDRDRHSLDRHYFSRYLAERVVGPASYSMGVVDILQQWSVQKKLERFGKVSVLKEDGDGLSAMDPHRYCMRFQHKMKDILGLRSTEVQQLQRRRELRQTESGRMMLSGHLRQTGVARTASGQLGVL
jgi:1-phosphatidylinositol-4-phosphate 5-kinase